MSTHSLTDAQIHLSNLIDRVLAGEEVVITRDGRPIVELRPVSAPPRRIAEAAIDWLAKNRVATMMPSTDAGTLVSQMRDEDWR